MKTPSDVGPVIAGRTFDRDDGPVVVSFHHPAPYPDPSHDSDPTDPPWRCFYTIEFPDGETKRDYAVGIDSMQALLLAIGGAEHRLRYVANGTPDLRPPVSWLGENDLGLRVPKLE